ncbi:MAG: TIGR04283 family arsenosugar biosynthesis glycosyltransferase [Ectothiorhodospiraceae bacterium]|nr:TIGR04283 family arsenosugar biosynthesis glycosyltransferase [Ectothiorhodospiraceae bacterium]MCH8503509.1 TIGR04283 family arsenosugar biosynthesis glycosyltransferase [Ectothiorhodospiraceae bacterium]
MISIIVPTLDEAGNISETLGRLQTARALGHELLVVDGGSSDATVELALPLADRVLHGPRGRARQMNAGAMGSQGDVLWFIHADTLVPDDSAQRIMDAVQEGASWGRFDVSIRGRARLLPVIAWFMNRRSRLTGIATGDQGMFVLRSVWDEVGGFPDIPLMEDIALSRALRSHAWPVCLPERLITSGRRWEQRGVWRTIVLMWRLRLAYFLGADPAELAKRYR